MFKPKKDFLYAAVAGVVTICFALPILYYSNDAKWTFTKGGVSISIFSFLLLLPLFEYIAYVIAEHVMGHVRSLSQLTRFAVTGLMNFSVDTGTRTMVSQWTGIDPRDNRFLPFIVFAITLAVVNSYFWQHIWTFSHATEKRNKKQFSVFIFVTLLGLIINIIVFKLAVHYVVGGIDNNALLITAANVLATAVSLFWNFFGYKSFVFNK